MSEELKDFVAELLAKPPGKPHSVKFEVDTDGDIQAFFEVMLIVMTEVLKTWYPPPITIALISDEDRLRLTQYFASFGIAFHLAIEDSVGRGVQINNREYLQQSRLEQMRFRIAHDGKLYTVRFSNLAVNQ
jgi:hypothetical protein